MLVNYVNIMHAGPVKIVELHVDKITKYNARAVQELSLLLVMFSSYRIIKACLKTPVISIKILRLVICYS